MALSARPRRTSSRIDVVRGWLASPLSHLVVSRETREAIQWLADEARTALTAPAEVLSAEGAGSTASPAPLDQRPKIGTAVRLLQSDSYLEREAKVGVGSVGTVVAHSRLARDDTGVLVDWGNGRGIRSDLDELALA